MQQTIAEQLEAAGYTIGPRAHRQAPDCQTCISAAFTGNANSASIKLHVSGVALEALVEESGVDPEKTTWMNIRISDVDGHAVVWLSNNQLGMPYQAKFNNAGDDFHVNISVRSIGECFLTNANNFHRQPSFNGISFKVRMAEAKEARAHINNHQTLDKKVWRKQLGL